MGEISKMVLEETNNQEIIRLRAELEKAKVELLSCEEYREEWHKQADQYFNELQSAKIKLSDHDSAAQAHKENAQLKADIRTLFILFLVLSQLLVLTVSLFIWK